MIHTAFFNWLRATTEARWADPSLRAASSSLGDPAWQPGTRWRGGMTDSDLRIAEGMFSVRLPAAYRDFLMTLHTPDPPLAALQLRGGRLVVVERRLFTDWTGATTPVISAFERPLEGLLRGVALGRWHPAWGDRPDDPRERTRHVRQLVAAAPRLVPLAGDRYLVASTDCDDGPVLAVHGADLAVVAPDLHGGLLRELGLSEDAAGRALGPAGTAGGASPARDAGDAVTGMQDSGRRIPFWSDLADGIPWLPLGEAVRT